MSDEERKVFEQALQENYHYRGFANFVNHMTDGTFNAEIAIGCIKRRLDFLEDDIKRTKNASAAEGE